MTKQENKNFIYTPMVQVGIYETLLSNLDTNFWIKECYNLKSSFPSRQISNEGGWQSENILEKPEFFNLINFLYPFLINFYKLPSIKILEMWVNISGFGDFNLVHNHVLHSHSASNFSGVLYLKVPPKSGNIVFYNPITFSDQLDVSTEEKLLILFPSLLHHSVKPNLSKEDRISIAFNYG